MGKSITIDTSKGYVFKQMEAFAIERHKIYLRRSAGQPFPWTDDPILQKYKFNNIYRELDKTTIWIKDSAGWLVAHDDAWSGFASSPLISWSHHGSVKQTVDILCLSVRA